MNQWTGALERYASTVARQTGQMLATLATNDGARMRVDWLLDTIFVAMVDELGERGVPRRVAADMLGMSHRTLQRRYATAADAIQVQGRSVWTNVVDILRNGSMSREDLASRTGRVPPVVLASILNNMIDSGWVSEDGDQLTLSIEPSRVVTDEELRDYIEIRRRAEPTVSQSEVAADLGLEVERVAEYWAMSGELLMRAEGDHAWMAMQRSYEQAMNLLQALALESADPRHSATFWRVRWDDKSPEFQNTLRRFVKTINVQISEMLEPVATHKDDEEGARFWFFTAYQSTELEDDEV